MRDLAVFKTFRLSWAWWFLVEVPLLVMTLAVATHEPTLLMFGLTAQIHVFVLWIGWRDRCRVEIRDSRVCFYNHEGKAIRRFMLEEVISVREEASAHRIRTEQGEFALTNQYDDSGELLKIFRQAESRNAFNLLGV